MGDRVAAVEQISVDRYGLDLRFGWPRPWLVLPEHIRAELTTANGQFAAAVTEAGRCPTSNSARCGGWLC